MRHMTSLDNLLMKMHLHSITDDVCKTVGWRSIIRARNASMTSDVYYTQLIIPRKIRTITIDHLPDINLN